MCNAASIRLTMLQLLQKEQIFTSVVLSLLLCGGWNWWHAFDFLNTRATTAHLCASKID